MEKIIKVSEKDESLGLEDKIKCHKGKGILHRGFSILVFNNKKQLLLTQRSKHKILWPLFWDNTCSSHPKKGESYIGAGKRRLMQELGFSCNLKLKDKFRYFAKYKKAGAEKEICALLVGKIGNKKIKPNKKEVASWKWVDFRKVKEGIKKNPRKYTPWLRIGINKIKKKTG